MTFKIFSITLIIIVLMVSGACSAKPGVSTAASSTTTVSSSATVTPTSSSNRSLFEILAAANAEVASVKIANQAYAAEHDGKYAADSGRLSKYLKGTPDATYYFNTDSGAITKTVKGDGITEPFWWDNATQMWQR